MVDFFGSPCDPFQLDLAVRPPPSSQGIPFALVPSQAQSGIECGVGSQRKFSIIFWYTYPALNQDKEKC